uniref:Uncharacterized protein n=1 Tax=Acrobeloides nanus TaxID=290746 RepID=A0A914CK26_9BILA
MFLKWMLLFSALACLGYAQYACVWYRSAPICGTGNDCPTTYPNMMYHADSSGNAQYCPNSFGSKCWEGEKNLCCNANVNLQNTNTYSCGSY